ncbi:hypothetical protein [Marinobacter gelidimuriae]|uniref:hypothetical protein n=1 Tax=Marinobacter gelidimuriae TaxID=2739064 RepID=UPI00058FC235|nr:hypothetical protein [Marinobacter gelidimuriae]
MQVDTFTEDTALDAAVELQRVLAARTHRRTVLGQEVTVPGQLGAALNLPRTVGRLQSRQARLREQGLEDFQQLWVILSIQTREKVLRAIGWYKPQELSWDDKRSNRHPGPDKGA